jgi:glycosyltransferase involved in cell wall biosynthesis
MNNFPKVSICIPAYKQTEYLAKLLDSIVLQKYKNYEIIITDDSPDDSVENVVKKYDFGECLKYIRNVKQLGSPENWNESIRLSSGEYIKIMHHDEWFNYEDSLTTFVETLDNNPGADFVFSAARGVNVQTKTTWLHRPTPGQLRQLKADPLLLYFGNFIGSPSNVMYRKCGNELFDKKLIWLVDFEFYIRLLQTNTRFVFINSDLVSSVHNAVHQISAQCVNDGKIQVSEHRYVYNKIKNRIPIYKRLKYFKYILKVYLLTMIKTRGA